MFNDLSINHNLTETAIDNYDINSHLEDQIQIQDWKVSGWRLDKINSMTKHFLQNW